MIPQTFSTHLRDSNGSIVADVFVEISEGGIKLEGSAGVLGHFPFQRVLQWAVTEPECFTFTVITEEGRKDVTLWSSAETIQALLRAVEETVQHLLAIKRAQKSGGGPNGKKSFKSMVDNIVGTNRALDAMSSPSGRVDSGGGLFSPAPPRQQQTGASYGGPTAPSSSMRHTNGSPMSPSSPRPP